MRMVNIWRTVSFLLLLQSLFIGYYAARGDQKMNLLVDAAKKGMKCYKVVKEITKIFLK